MKEILKELTKAEEQVMQTLWHLEKAFVKDIIEKLPEPKPAYNTVSTIIRILEKKGFVSHEDFGSTYRYYPLVSKKKYTSQIFGSLFSNYFGSSYSSLVSHFTKDKEISLSELEEIKKYIDFEIEKKKEL